MNLLFYYHRRSCGALSTVFSLTMLFYYHRGYVSVSVSLSSVYILGVSNYCSSENVAQAQPALHGRDYQSSKVYSLSQRTKSLD